MADYDDERQDEPILGANDGGSGVGVLIEIARLLSQQESRLGIDIILFDAEDYGNPDNSSANSASSWCIGSKYWSENPHTDNYFAQYGILLDMVGAKGPDLPTKGCLEIMLSAFSKKCGNVLTPWAWGLFSYQMTPQIIDDHLYLNTVANIPTIDIIEYDNNTQSGFEHWHPWRRHEQHRQKHPQSRRPNRGIRDL